MKKIILILIMLIVGQIVYSQDLILTRDNDSLNCKITKIKPDYIYFTYLYNTEVKKSILAMTDIIKFQKNFYYKSELPIEYLITNEYSKFRIGFRGGFSYLLAKLPEGIDNNTKDYLKSFKTGYNLGINANYFFNKMFGIGLKYSFFKTKANGTLLFDDGQGGIVNLNISENRSDNFFGASFVVRVLNKFNKNAFIASASTGYLSYNNNLIIGSVPLNIKGSTLGFVLDVGYHLSLSQNLSLGFSLSAMLGALNKFTIDDGFSSETVDLAEGEFESMSRIDLSIGLSFNK